MRVACQARRDTDGDGLTKVVVYNHGEPDGDALHRYLFVRPGEGDPVDEVRAVSDDERWLVIAEGQRLSALEVASGRRVDLGLAPRQRVDAREVVFSPDATRVAVVAGTRLTLWDLTDGSKLAFALGEGFFAKPEFVSDELEWLDTATGKRRELPGLGDVHLLSGRLVGVGGSIIDFADGKIIGAYSLVERPLGLRPDGRILVRVGEEGEGPLRWVRPLD